MTIESELKMGVQPRMNTDEHRWTGWTGRTELVRHKGEYLTQSRKDAKAQRGTQGKNRSEGELSSAFVRFRSVTGGRASAYVRVRSSAFVRIHPHSFAFVRLRFFYFLYDTESGKGPPFAKAMVGKWQFLPGGGELRIAPRCVTAKTPEYAALAGLKHRDSPQYVTKKICLPSRGASWRILAGKGGYWRIRFFTEKPKLGLSVGSTGNSKSLTIGNPFPRFAACLVLIRNKNRTLSLPITTQQSSLQSVARSVAAQNRILNEIR